MIHQFKESMSLKTKRLKQLYYLIRKYGPVSKSTLIELTKLKQTTCTRLIEELLQAELIVESGLGESSGGRKPYMYEIKPDRFYLVGVDISRTHTKVLLMDLNLSIIDKAQLSMGRESTPELTIKFIETEVKNMFRQHQIEESRLLGIGIGAVGPLDRERGMMITPLHFPAPGWENVPIVNLLAQKFETVVYLDNGANTAVLGEYRSGFWKSVDSLVFNITGVGIRCGVLTNGQVVRGPVDMEGAYGHMAVDVHGPKCTCGSSGCLEAYATIPAITKEVVRLLNKGEASLLREGVPEAEQVTFEHICLAVQQHDPVCCEVVENAAFHYGIGLSNMMYLIHPEMILLGGALVTEMDLFYRVATETAMKRAAVYPGYEVKISRGNLGENAAAVGAGCMVFDHFLQ